ncbi:hypothetical protein BaRGS_00036125 [Batillaria attramentaria]|uniref:AAA+ ATPase domain-containing protein n=1 Tax=Batillaria attramentaria TaxID=370345 RepID=A0ABD0JCV1_9CAEN
MPASKAAGVKLAPAAAGDSVRRESKKMRVPQGKAGESTKEKQQRLLQEREQKRRKIDVRVNYIMDILGQDLGMDYTEVEEHLLDGNQIDEILKFLGPGEQKCLMFYFQEPEQLKERGSSGVATSGRFAPMMPLPVQQAKMQASVAAKGTKPRLFITDGRTIPLRGTALIFMRNLSGTRCDEIEDTNLFKDLHFTRMDTGGKEVGAGLLQAVESIMSRVYIPALQGLNNKGWEQLDSPHGAGIRTTFLSHLESFANVLSGAQRSLDEKETLAHCEAYDLSMVHGPPDYIKIATSAEAVEKVEECMRGWIKQIDHILVRSEQIRREADNVGPRAELEHWKKRMAKFSFLLDQLRGQEVKAVIGVLQCAKSKLIPVWRDLDGRITDTANEAKDNVKFLYTLETACDPLYNSNPVKMLETIPGLINAARMIHSISRYYNTSEKMTSLFIKVTNQMITACKTYITDGSTETVWSLGPDVVRKRLRECIHLNEQYKFHYHEVKKNLEKLPGERQFDFSEMYIFGKFDTFSRRLEKIIEMFDIIDIYAHLPMLKLEGIEIITNKLNSIVAGMKKKNYNFLDSRKENFDLDFEDFKRQINELHNSIVSFMNTRFETVTSTQGAMRLLRRFESIALPNMPFEEKYKQIIQLYGRDLEMVAKMYRTFKSEPIIARNMPPIAGKIAWARQLYRRINEPMEVFKQRPALFFDSPDAKKIIRNFNRLSKVLIEFELLYYRGWLREVEICKAGLQASLLVRHPETRELYINFDMEIMTLLRETDCMQRMGLEIPPIAHTLRARAGLPVLELNPDDLFVEDVYKSLNELEVMVTRVNEILQYRVDSVLWDIVHTKLCAVPEDEPWSVEYFVHNTEKMCARGAQILHSKSQTVEEGINELIDMLLTDFPAADDDDEEEHLEEAEHHDESADMDVEEGAQEAERHLSLKRMSDEERSTSRSMHEPRGSADERRLTVLKRRTTEAAKMQSLASELIAHFCNRNVDALQRCIRNSLESLRKRISADVNALYEKNPKSRPLFRTDVVLAIPNMVVQPSVEEVQSGLNKAAQTIVSVCKGVPQWSKKRKQHRHKLLRAKEDEEGAMSIRHHQKSLAEVHEQGETEDRFAIDVQANNFYKAVAESKDIIKLTALLSSAINENKKIVTSTLTNFRKYSFIWEQDKDVTVEEFSSGNPNLIDFEEKTVMYEKLEEEISDLPEYHDCGPISLYTEKMKLGLTTETKSWRLLFAKSANKKYTSLMKDVLEFIEDILKRLCRPIKDLDDIRYAMAAMKEIRANEINIEHSIIPIEECFSMLSKHELPVADEEAERCDTLRYEWDKVRTQEMGVLNYLLEVQPSFKDELVHDVQVFNKDCDDFYKDYEVAGPMVPGVAPREASDRLLVFQNTFDSLFRKFTTYTGGEELFGLEVSSFPRLMKIKKELNLLQKLYGLYNNVNDAVRGYYDIFWQDVDIDKINTELTDFQNRCKKLPKALKGWPAFEELRKKIDDFNEMVPLLELMANKAMKKRHWIRMENLTGSQFPVDSDNFTLRDIMEAPLLKYKDDIEDICISAVKETDIEAKLKQVIADWSNQIFQFGHFKNRGELLLKGDTTQEIISLMEDSLMVLGSLLSNRYNTPFKAQIQTWVANLSNSNEVIENWMNTQNLWVYLEAVFVGGDIAKQLPQEAKRFSNIDKSWVKIMQRAHETPNVIQCCVGDDTLMQLLPYLLEQLEVCQKSLTGYLEKKRLAFPRFFFVSDPALLEILGQASDPHTIQAHLLSIFDNIKNVKFHEKQYDMILNIISSEKETIELDKPVKAEGNVEVWLMNLLIVSQRSLHNVIRAAAIAMQDSGLNLLEFINTFPAQVGLLGIQMIWTRDATEALNNAKTDRKVMATTNTHFLDMLNTLIAQTTRELTKVERTKFETLITIHVHQRDIFDDLVKKSIKNPLDFEWQKQSRFYFLEDQDKCIICITDTETTYQNEFLGCTDRLVITPLTDRCYITLSQALSMSMGGAPAGPAGTGKTETTKDMGRCLGKYVVVFNCSDQMDFRGLGRIYKGLAQSGSWGCFDEFNRIELPVLSVAAQQIAIVLACKKERKKQFIFTDGDIVDMNPEFGIFLTMNPGYAGRQELPENLKINFRTVAMMVPDRQIIMRVKLAACGFIENIVLARKFFTLYKLCEEQLTKQVHYDFGLRNILSVLRTLGSVKRQSPNDSEMTIVMRVLRDMNLSKLVDQDEPLFLSLIADLFPGIVLDKAGYPKLEAAILNNVKEAKLIYHAPWVLKVVQLFETQRVRHGLMTLGPSGAGKTCCIHMLMKAMTDCGDPHKEWRMNPKAITAPQMFGRLDVATNDWTDGIFSTLWRRTTRVKKGENVWLALDGPVDAIWIENLNSVLDDNKTLTLANGDRIPMAPNCKILFEPHNIDNASPATVSRVGMVYMSSSGLGWSPILQGWLNTRPQIEQEVFTSLFGKSFPDVLQYALQSLTFKMVMLEAFVISQACKLLTGLIPDKDDKDYQQMSKTHYEHLYVFALMWSVGAFLELDDRFKMEQYIRASKDFQLDLPDIPSHSEATMFDYFVAQNGAWTHWNDRVVEYTYPSDHEPEYTTILVPNVDNVRTEFLIKTIAKQGKAVLLIGEQGTAKTVMITNYMDSFNSEYRVSQSMNFSSATTPLLFQRTVESYVDKRVGSTYGPPAGKTMTIFVDDINMPIVNEWGDQVANEIVRQLMENGGFYSLEKPGDFTTIVDVQFLGAMIQPGGGRNDIPQRLKRQFVIYNCTLPSNTSIDKIFSIIGCGYFCTERGFTDSVQKLIKRLVPLTRKFWQLTKIKMLPTPAKFHYIFNLRDLSRIWQGMVTTISSVVAAENIVIALWKHECCRVIADRFVSYEDQHWFTRTMFRVVGEDLGDEDAAEPTGEEGEEEADFEVPRVYEPIPSYEDLEERLRMFMGMYNEQARGGKMDLVFFKDAMVHLVKISRIISTPRGHALLVGVGGSGKQSLTRLSSAIYGYGTFQITLTRSYNVNNLLDDLKFLYRTAGGDGHGITFIFTDNEVKDEGFLEYLNNMLSSGVVANLFPRDEMDEILGNLAPPMKKEFPKRPPTMENLKEYYLYRTRKIFMLFFASLQWVRSSARELSSSLA